MKYALTSTASIYIPPSINDVPITAIGPSAFENQTGLSAVTIPGKVTKIGNNAFSNTGIWNNTANNSVVYADKWAVGFKGTVSNSTGELLLRTDTVGIGDNAFSQIPGLEEIIIPVGVTTIGSNAFSNNLAFNRIWIPSSVTFIDSNAFANCSSLTIYAQATSKPVGWQNNWKPNDCLVNWGCPTAYQQTIYLANILGVTPSVTGGPPVIQITSTAQYTGTVTWKVTSTGAFHYGAFNANIGYTATINLTATNNYTFQGVTAGFFTVPGTITTNNAVNSGVVDAVFPATVPPNTITTKNIEGVTVPVNGGMPVTAITETSQYTVTVTWSPNHSIFAAGEQYTATITLFPKPGYTLQGVSADYFKVPGAVTSNTANNGVITAEFPTINVIGSIEIFFDAHVGGKSIETTNPMGEVNDIWMMLSNQIRAIISLTKNQTRTISPVGITFPMKELTDDYGKIGEVIFKTDGTWVLENYIIGTNPIIFYDWFLLHMDIFNRMQCGPISQLIIDYLENTDMMAIIPVTMGLPALVMGDGCFYVTYSLDAKISGAGGEIAWYDDHVEIIQSNIPLAPWPVSALPDSGVLEPVN